MFIVHKIEEFLRRENPPELVNPLEWATRLHGFGDMFIRQFLEKRDGRTVELCPEELTPLAPKDIYFTDISHPCLRKIGLKIWDEKRDERVPLEPRARMKFFFGDIIEQAVVNLAELAGVDIRHHQMSCTLPINDKSTARGRLDGILWREEDRVLHVVDVKSITGAGFQKAKHQGVDDEWGYITQVSLYSESPEITKLATEHGFHIGDPIIVYVSTDTGHMHEEMLVSSMVDVEKAREKAKIACFAGIGNTNTLVDDLQGLPPVEETKRRQKNKVKFDEPTGRMILSKQCGYCEFRDVCWNYETEVKSGRPIYIVGDENNGS